MIFQKEINKLKEQIKEKLNADLHKHLSGEIYLDGNRLCKHMNTGEFSSKCEACLDLQELYAKLQVYEELSKKVEAVIDVFDFNDIFSKGCEKTIENLKTKLAEI